MGCRDLGGGALCFGPLLRASGLNVSIPLTEVLRVCRWRLALRAARAKPQLAELQDLIKRATVLGKQLPACRQKSFKDLAASSPQLLAAPYQVLADCLPAPLHR